MARHMLVYDAYASLSHGMLKPETLEFVWQRRLNRSILILQSLPRQLQSKWEYIKMMEMASKWLQPRLYATDFAKKNDVTPNVETSLKVTFSSTFHQLS